MSDLDRTRKAYAARLRELGDEGGARLLEQPMRDGGWRPLWQGVAAAAVILALALAIAAVAALAPSRPREIVVHFDGPLVVRLER